MRPGAPFTEGGKTPGSQRRVGGYGMVTGGRIGPRCGSQHDTLQQQARQVAFNGRHTKGLFASPQGVSSLESPAFFSRRSG